MKNERFLYVTLQIDDEGYSVKCIIDKETNCAYYSIHDICTIAGYSPKSSNLYVMNNKVSKLNMVKLSTGFFRSAVNLDGALLILSSRNNPNVEKIVDKIISIVPNLNLQLKKCNVSDKNTDTPKNIVNTKADAIKVLRLSAKLQILKMAKSNVHLSKIALTVFLPENVVKLIIKQILFETGLPIEVNNIGNVSVNYKYKDLPQSTTKIKDICKNKMKVGFVSDTHIGSIYQQLTNLHRLYEYFLQQEVDYVVHAGDLTDGNPYMHKGHINNIFIHDFLTLMDYIVLNYPYSNKFKTYMIDGNHDFSWMKNMAGLPARVLSNRRLDIIYVSQGESKFVQERTKMRVDVIHPSGGMPYAKSYRSQKIWLAIITQVLQLNKRLLPHIIAVGHLHVFNYFKQAGIHVIQLPGLQAKTLYLNNKALCPCVGGVLATFDTNEDGQIIKVVPELIDMNHCVIKNDY